MKQVQSIACRIGCKLSSDLLSFSEQQLHSFDIFQQISQEQYQTILVVTHDEDFSSRTDQIIELKDGEIVN